MSKPKSSGDEHVAEKSASVRPVTAYRKGPHDMEYAVAAALHGWAFEEMHTGKPMELSEADYRGAVEAACASSHPLKPHPAALSTFKPALGS